MNTDEALAELERASEALYEALGPDASPDPAAPKNDVVRASLAERGAAIQALLANGPRVLGRPERRRLERVIARDVRLGTLAARQRDAASSELAEVRGSRDRLGRARSPRGQARFLSARA